MGQFKVRIALHPRDGGSPRSLEARVDTGAAYSVIPRPLLEALGCQHHRTQRVILVDGRIEEWTVAQIDVECEGRQPTRLWVRRTVLPCSAQPPSRSSALALTR